ncbi:uncharacterized protein MJAP1_004009 [Malassezia japonica]|uniref:EF-hand domain-containing protein n=1 Tax=Malassezia japonica TaxID=223818 RepID=A0AAF0F9V9_9BASI|nr:uncharacterized protein MJAP1_004009 [Malassezia japonica]WFD41018.1 hypothetical protein MJAP1_004009 [Malassezia japonica]
MSEGGALARLSPAQIKQLQRVFYALDRDEDGNVSESDLAKALRSLGARDAPTEAKEHFQADVLGSDAPELDATSFLTMMATRMGPVSDARKLLEAFESFDERDEGVVDVDVVKEILANDQEAIDQWLVPPFLDRTRKRFEYRKFVEMLGMCEWTALE